MAYRLKLKAHLALEVRRIALEQIEIARNCLLHHDDPAAAVHDARRSLKRLRAMLRLVRPALGETWFKQGNQQLAGLGQRLARTRDLDVMVLTLAKLENGAGGLPKGLAERLKQSITQARNTADQPRRLPAPDRNVGGALRRAEKLFSTERLRGVDIDHVADGLRQCYRRARHAFHEAYECGSDEAFHEWRKSTQAHWRHMQLLGRSWPESIGARAGEAKELSRLLGDDHDLSVLLAYARNAESAELSSHDLAALRAACLSSQRQIRDLAKPHGERLFVERPRQLTRRVLRYWKAAEHLSRLLPPDRETPAHPRARLAPGSNKPTRVAAKRGKAEKAQTLKKPASTATPRRGGKLLSG